MYKVTLINDGIKTVIHHPFFNDVKVQTGQIKQGINVADGFSFTILPSNPGYNLIRPLKTLIQVFNTKTQKMEFDGRILMPTESMSESGMFAKSFLCESELGYLNDSVQRHGEYHDITIRQFLEVMIANHNSDIANDNIDKKFVVGEVTVTNNTDNLYRYLGYESTFDSIGDKLISRLGGELRVRKENGLRYLDYLQSVGTTKNTEIRLSKNLKSITKEVDPSEIITRLIPLGVSLESEDEGATDASRARLTIESVNNGKDYLEDEEAKQLFSVVAKSMVWDDITQASILKTRGEQFLQENNRVKVKYSISALDLSLIGLDTDSFDIGNHHPVINPVMNINETLRVIGKTIDIINPNDNNLTVGDLFKTTSQYQYEANKSRQNVIELQETVSNQAKTISTLKTEIIAVNDAVSDINQAITESDLPGLEQAVTSLEEAINDLNTSIGNIPIYDVATPTSNGLMPSLDKAKLNRISILNNIDLDEVNAKLNLITVSEVVDIDDLVARVTALEGGTA